MMKTPPLKTRTRRSFGGKHGIWWRMKTIRPCPTITTLGSEDGSKTVTTSKVTTSGIISTKPTTPLRTSTTMTTKPPNHTRATIGWDPILCRPIYNHPPPTTTGLFLFGNTVDDDDGEDTSDNEENNIETASPTTSSPELLQKTPVKRTNKFFGLGKRPLPLFIDSDLDLDRPLPAEKKKNRHIEDSPSSKIANNAIIEREAFNPLTGNENEELESPQGGTQRRGRGRRAVGRVRSSKNNRIKTTSNPLNKHDNDGSEQRNDTTFDFQDNDAENILPVPGKSTNKIAAVTARKVIQQPHAKSSLDEARAFFDRLDKTESLTLDASSTPIAPGKVYRTKAHLRLSSPRFTREYQNYYRAIQGTGVTPLAPQDYARNRLNFCRPGEFYNGLLEGGDGQVEDE